MRRITLLLLTLVLLVPAVSHAGRSAAGDGSLVVSNADGVITVQVKGVIFGHFDHGSLTVLDFKADGNALPTVSSAKQKLSGAKLNVVYSGSDVRFLFPDGKYTLRFEGSGIDLSAVGRGTVQFASKSPLDDGTVALNGAKALPMSAVGSVATFGGTLAVTATPTTEKTTTTTEKTTNNAAGTSSSNANGTTNTAKP